MDKNKIWKLINNQLPPEQQQDVWEEINASSEALRNYKELKKNWSLSGAEVSFSEKELDVKLATFKRQYNKGFNSKNRMILMLKYAAILLIAFSASYALWYNTNSSFKTNSIVKHFESGTGNVSTILLADGSQIWLNSNSSIDIINQEASTIELSLRGEALFDIIHNENRRFIVNAQDLKIEDLGTRFNVRSYIDDDEIIATLIEGEIEVSNFSKQMSEILKPGQQLKYSILNKQFSVGKIDTTFIGKWTENKFEFVDKTLLEIARDLENWYGVTIAFENNQIANERFTGVIQKSTSINKVLDILAYTAGIKYSINETKNSIEIMIQ